MLTRFLLTRFCPVIVAVLFASQLAADLQQPQSVKPITASAGALYPNDDILARKYNPLEHQWRVARLPVYRQQNDALPSDYMDQLNELRVESQSAAPPRIKPMPMETVQEASGTPAATGLSRENVLQWQDQHGWNGSCGSGFRPRCTY